MTAPARRLADRLASAQHARFVGRQAELDLFRSALLAAEPAFAVVYIYGPGGVGKTALLLEFAHLAADRGRRVVRVDGREVDPSPAEFARAAAVEDSAGILLVDTYEALAPLDSWLRHSFLPELPAQILVAIAGRN